MDNRFSLLAICKNPACSGRVFPVTFQDSDDKFEDFADAKLVIELLKKGRRKSILDINTSRSIIRQKEPYIPSLLICPHCNVAFAPDELEYLVKQSYGE